MHLQATSDEKLKVVHACIETGLPWFVNYGYRIDSKPGQYNTAYDALIAAGKPESELYQADVWTEMLKRGYGVKFKNTEYPEHTVTLTLALIEANWNKCPLDRMAPLAVGKYDSYDADIVMQYLLLGSEIFG